MQQTDTLIVGAGLAGLASAAALQKRGIAYLVIEREAAIAAPWRHHYDRLHLHTHRDFSALPYRKFSHGIPRYPSRLQVLEYLEDYRQEFGINPIFHSEVKSIKREDGYWITDTGSALFASKYLVMATGAYGRPRTPDFNGMETFPGKIIHSAGYRTGRDFHGQKVLVAGFGNSACEIALDLYEQGARPSMAVRSPVNVVPRDLFGVSIQRISLLLSALPARIADAISAPLIRLTIGDLTKQGLKKMPYGPFERFQRDGIPPVLDIGTLKYIRQGKIKVRAGIDHIAGSTVYFTDGKKDDFDAIVAAIGYYRDYGGILEVGKNRFEDLKAPVSEQKYFGNDGLYFCGFWISPTGQIREISRDAKRVAAHIAASFS